MGLRFLVCDVEAVPDPVSSACIFYVILQAASNRSYIPAAYGIFFLVTMVMYNTMQITKLNLLRKRLND
jgi:hypothetical protein